MIERLGHGFHGFDLVFELEFLFDRPAAHVATTGGIAIPQYEEVTDFGKRESAMLGLFDEMNAARGILVIKAISAPSPVGRFDQSFALVKAERIRARSRQRRKLTYRQQY